MGLLAYYILSVGFVCFVWWMFLRACAERVRRWAVDNGFAIIDLRYQWIRHGPFFFVLGHRAVFRFTIKDGKGRLRRGWIRTGVWPPARTEARWDEQVGPVRMSWSIPLTCVIGGLVLMIVGVFHGVLVPGNAGVSGAPSMQSASLLIVGGVCLAAGIVLGLWRWRAGAADDIDDPPEG